MNKKSFRTVLAVSMVSMTLMVVGCASKPTIGQQGSRVYYVPEFYTVKPGDSLSKISAQFGLNYLEVARLNNIDAIDKIYVNQSLRLRDNGKGTPRLVQIKPIEQAPPIQRQSVLQQAQTASVPQQAIPATPQVGLSTSVPSTSSSTASTIPIPTVAQPQAMTGNQLRWVAPSNGRIIDRFNASQNKKGLRFGGNMGDPIYAAAVGEVVYADDGLKEYGKLVLIRHTQGYITAYAHNNKLLVKVGDKVTAGQKIAEMGNTGTSSTMLEFQIRLDGKPIDPLSVLPIS